MKKLTSKQFVEKQLHEKRGEWTTGDCHNIDCGDFALSTIRKAINACGMQSVVDNNGYLFAVKN